MLLPGGERPATVRWANGVIAAIESYESTDAGGDASATATAEGVVIDWGDAAILPGLVDPHVHLNEPGRTEWEGFATGTAAAAAGGFTALVDMPLNSSPVTTSAKALAAKRAAAEGKLSCDVAFYGGVVPGVEAGLAALLDGGVVGMKAFLCHSGLDEFPAATERELRAVMPVLAERGLPLLVHAELVHETPPIADPRSATAYAATRPPSFERDAIELMIRLCRETGCLTHVVHLADAGSLPVLAEARAEGLPLTVETCPHYLTFSMEEIPDGATAYKCAPPIRDAANREGLWQGLADGVIDFIATDHSPCPPEMKHLDPSDSGDPEDADRDGGRFDRAWGGISSVQLSLPAVSTEATRRGHTLDDVARWLAKAPSGLVGLDSSIFVGLPANLVAFDPDAEWVVRGAELLHRHLVTPYEGRTLRGVVRRTLLRGEPAVAGRGRAL